jgi:hypothetical protein
VSILVLGGRHGNEFNDVLRSVNFRVSCKSNGVPHSYLASCVLVCSADRLYVPKEDVLLGRDVQI